MKPFIISGQRFSTGGSRSCLIGSQLCVFKKGPFEIQGAPKKMHTYFMMTHTVHKGIQTKVWREEIDSKMLLKVWKCSWSAKTMFEKGPATPVTTTGIREKVEVHPSVQEVQQRGSRRPRTWTRSSPWRWSRLKSSVLPMVLEPCITNPSYIVFAIQLLQLRSCRSILEWTPSLQSRVWLASLIPLGELRVVSC